MSKIQTKYVGIRCCQIPLKFIFIPQPFLPIHNAPVFSTEISACLSSDSPEFLDDFSGQLSSKVNKSSVKDNTSKLMISTGMCMLQPTCKNIVVHNKEMNNVSK